MDDNTNQDDQNMNQAQPVQDQPVSEENQMADSVLPNVSEESQDLNTDPAQNDTTEAAEPQEEAAPSSDEPQISDNPNPEPAQDAVEPEQVEAAQEATADQAEEQTPEESSAQEAEKLEESAKNDNPNAKWYVVHTYSGHENKVATALKQRVESEHLEHKILDVIVPTQDKIEIRSGKKSTVKEKIFPGYILVKMELDDNSWLAVRTTQGVTSFVGIGNKPTPIPEQEVRTIVKFMTQGAAPTFKDVYLVNDTVKITDGPFAEFIGKVDSVDKEKGKVRVLVSIFGRETPVELDFLQVQKL